MITYEQFLNTLVNPITSFASWFLSMCNYLVTNYFFITIIGIVVISSLILYFFDIIKFGLLNSSKDLDNVNASVRR